MQKKGGSSADIVVIGAGMLRVMVLGGGDRDFRAASANFGPVWLQSKGMDMPAYQRLTRDSVDLRPNFLAEPTDTTAIDLQYERNGGLTICQFTAPLQASPRSVSVIFTVIFVDGMFGVIRARSLQSNKDADWSLGWATR
jgi:hypothetical protein